MNTFSNYQMDQMLFQLEGVLDRSDAIGYAAARNTRILRSECAEFLSLKNELLKELGETELDEQGSPTGRITLTPDSENFDEFIERLNAWAEIEHPVEIYKLPIEEAIGKLSGTQLLELDWMFEEE